MSKQTDIILATSHQRTVPHCPIDTQPSARESIEKMERGIAVKLHNP